MSLRSRPIRTLRLENGRRPFGEWFSCLRSTEFRRAVDSRITRIRDGNFGDHKSVGGGVFELRINKGPGLRVYYGCDADETVVLLGGGDKKNQKKDIKAAQAAWRRYRHEN